jgi:hypothetical protein
MTFSGSRNLLEILDELNGDEVLGEWVFRFSNRRPVHYPQAEDPAANLSANSFSKT